VKRFDIVLLTREVDATEPQLGSLADIVKSPWMCSRASALECADWSFNEFKNTELELVLRDHRKVLGLLDPPEAALKEAVEAGWVERGKR